MYKVEECIKIKYENKLKIRTCTPTLIISNKYIIKYILSESCGLLFCLLI